MVRKLTANDALRVKELQGEYAWEFGPDFESGYAFVDANDVPVLIVGAWKRAEVHLLIDSEWGTPGARMVALQKAHDVMEKHLYVAGYREVHTFFSKVETFCRRLKRLGWVQSAMTSWHREVRNG